MISIFKSHSTCLRLASVAAALLLACCSRPAAGHAGLVSPPSRNWAAYLDSSYYWTHGLNAGGSKATAGGGKLTWPDISLGSLCGDAVGQARWDTPGPLTAAYSLGQVIDIDVLVAVNHLGRFDFKLCDVGAKPGEPSKCHQLQRADGKGTLWYLPFLKNWSGGNNGADQPAYGDGSFSWYALPSLRAKEGCRGRVSCNEFAGMVVYRTQWRLPAGVTCQHCKLVWTWMTASSCWPPCPPANAGEPTCHNVQVFPECGKPGTAYPEHFMNCADVRVAADGEPLSPGSPTLQNKPSWEAEATLHTGPFGTPAAYRMGSSKPVVPVKPEPWIERGRIVR